MNQPATLKKRIETGQALHIAEVSPPRNADPEAWRALVRRFKTKIQTIGICDNRDEIGMSAVAAASLALAEGVFPILHMTTRDRNRVALMSDYLGARALGIDNLLCTTGTHQTLGAFRSARNVYDLDTIQLLKACADNDAEANGSTLCLGATASPYADPMPLQMIRLKKKRTVGAKFMITQPVFDIDGFLKWWKAVEKSGIRDGVAVVAGIEPLLSAEAVADSASRRPDPRIPKPVADRIAAKPDAASQRAEGLAVAVETIERLRSAQGLRGFAIGGQDPDAILAIIEKAGLGSA